MIVRKLRLQKGWSQDQLAEFTGLSVRTIQGIERGQKPSLESSKALAAVFEVDISTFITEDQTMTETVNVDHDEVAAMRYAKRIKEFYEGLIAYVVLAIVFFSVMGFGEPILYWIFLGVGAGLVVQGLLAFEVIRFPNQDWEKKLIEKKLGRKL